MLTEVDYLAGLWALSDESLPWGRLKSEHSRTAKGCEGSAPQGGQEGWTALFTIRFPQIRNCYVAQRTELPREDAQLPIFPMFLIGSILGSASTSPPNLLNRK